jgi:hypothetical protein
MANREPKQLTIKRRPRGFQQDVELAMGSDPMRAIVALVTNADDAYFNAEGSGRRKIRIEVERRRKGAGTLIKVMDRARGMTPEEMEERLAEEGKRSSGFEAGEDRRGLFGRGAKDIVHFGPVAFESERGGRRGILKLEYENAPTGRASIEESAAPSKSHGTTVSLHVQSRFSVKVHDGLKGALSRHFALRPILMDQKYREVTLVDKIPNKVDRLLYNLPKGKTLETSLTIEIPGFPGEQIILDLYESTESLDDGERIEYWRHSVLITSGRAAYENFVGKFSRDPWNHYLGRLFGIADIPGIRRLIKDYDDRLERGDKPEASNPIRLVRRDRAGLVGRDEHPFVDAVYKALEERIQPHLERLREEAEKTSESPLGSDLQKRLKDLGRLLSRLLQDEEIDGGLGGGAGRLPPVGLSVIPSARVAEPGQPASVLVRYRSPEDEEIDPIVFIQTNHDTGASSQETLPLVEREGYWSRTFVLGARNEGDATDVVFEVGRYRETCVVEWRHRDVPPVEKLEFEHAACVVNDGNKRSAKLLAPWQLALSNGRLPSRQLSGSPNVYVAGQDDWIFGYDERRECAAYLITVHGRGIGSRAKMVASLGEEIAECEFNVSAAGPEGIAVQIKDFEFQQRAFMSEDGKTLYVNAKEPSIGRYLGAKRTGWPGQNQLYFRSMLAEIIAFTLSRYVIQKRRQDERQTASDVFIAHTRLMDKWLSRVHAALIPSTDLPKLE